MPRPPQHLRPPPPSGALSLRAGPFGGACGWMLVLLLAAPLVAEPPRHQYEVKAALLYGFTKFVQWPESSFSSPQAPFVIGILGRDPFGSRIDSVLDAKSAQGRPIQIRRLERPAQAAACHILFLGPMDEAPEQAALQQLRNAPVLTIGESPGFWEHGGAIQFILVTNRVHFRIDLKATREAGLQVDPSLLKVAREIRNNLQPMPKSNASTE